MKPKICSHTDYLCLTVDMFYWLCLDCGFRGFGTYQGSHSKEYVFNHALISDSFLSVCKMVNEFSDKEIKKYRYN